LGQDDQFPPPRLSIRFASGKQTFAGTRGNEEDASIAARRRTSLNRANAGL